MIDLQDAAGAARAEEIYADTRGAQHVVDLTLAPTPAPALTLTLTLALNLNLFLTLTLTLTLTLSRLALRGQAEPAEEADRDLRWAGRCRLAEAEERQPRP